MDAELKSALDWLDVSDLTRDEWVRVGMALKEAGEPVSVWDAWSRNDVRYHEGECARLWRGFVGSRNPVKTGSIIQMAKDRGWTKWNGTDGAMDWDDVITYDGAPVPVERKPTEELIAYLSTLFESTDIVGYVTNDVWRGGDDGRWLPGKGCYDQTAAQLIDSLRKYPDDIGATVGDWKKEAGAWIRFNPLDGHGVSNANVVAWRYTLVESDEMEIEEQRAAYERLQLPIACLVHSGGKSLHAIVHIDAETPEEYRERVDLLYKYLEDNGVKVDKQNKNASRLSRMPGITRNGKRQALVGVNLGRANWADWLSWTQGSKLPRPHSLAEYDMDNPPEPPAELIHGILRRGHKMIISGASKAGKSFLLAQLAVSIAHGREWLGFKCEKGHVLYINFEIDEASFIGRFAAIYKALGIDPTERGNIIQWTLRGHAEKLDVMTPLIIQQMMGQGFDAVIIDPIYKVIMGDENSASDMGAFCNEFDRIATQTGASVIYCHHHSKGAQGGKVAQDRMSGSGVFARDPDAILDLVEVELDDNARAYIADGNETGFHVESSLREFANIKPLDIWFDWPLHRVDDTGYLAACRARGTKPEQKNTKSNFRQIEFDKAFMASDMDGDGKVKMPEICEYLGKDRSTVQRWIRSGDVTGYVLGYGVVCRAE